MRDQVLLPRLTDEQAVSQARRLDAFAVSADDPRLSDMAASLHTGARIAQMIGPSPALVVIEWPDTSRAYVVTRPDPARQEQALIDAYRDARNLLERLQLEGVATSGTSSH